MDYIVTIGYIDFAFTGKNAAQRAVEFAEAAKKAFVPSDTRDKISVTVELKMPEIEASEEKPED